MVSLINSASVVTSHLVLNLRHNIHISRLWGSLYIVVTGNGNGNDLMEVGRECEQESHSRTPLVCRGREQERVMYVDLSVCLVGSTTRTRPVRQSAVSVHRWPYIIYIAAWLVLSGNSSYSIDHRRRLLAIGTLGVQSRRAAIVLRW